MPCRKDWTKAQEALRSPNDSHATSGRLPDTGHAIAATPPSSVRKSRRLISSIQGFLPPCVAAEGSTHRVTLPQGWPQVIGQT
jgi:hypothetical protein